MKGIFDGIRVLSLAEQLPGPYATLLLADLGADVILVERPAGGDPARAFPSFFRSVGRNKRSLCLDLKTETGRTDFVALAAEADVVLEGYRPGTMDRLGVGYKVLSARNPRLIFASITGFGQDGPSRMRPAHDLSYQAVAGMVFGSASTPPAMPEIPFGDLSSATFAAFAIAAALYGRERSGHGTAIDVSMTDGLVSWMTPYLVPHMSGDKAFEVFDEPAYGLFTCGDGKQLTLSIAHEDHFWAALCAALELPQHASLKAPERRRRCAELKGQITAILARQPRAHWAGVFDATGNIAWSPLHDFSGVLQEPHFRARGLFQRLDNGEEHILQPVQFSAYGSSIRRAAPSLGEHSQEILGKTTAIKAAG
ncbi:CaiB/BaiF CoA transferase family protein [Ferrovibrio sp.]|uniref:CaiB/BaiF CoA transferase family protein n=1 Tax=Ferrovibrio sp. TaxID=1917215 RepID=UPI003D0D06EF